MLGLNPNSQSRKFICVQRRDNRLQAIVSAGRAAGSNAYLSERQSQIIRYDYQALTGLLQFMFRRQTTNRFSAQVHIGLRLNQFDSAAFNLAATNAGLTLAPRDLNAASTG